MVEEKKVNKEEREKYRRFLIMDYMSSEESETNEMGEKCFKVNKNTSISRDKATSDFFVKTDTFYKDSILKQN